MFKRALVFLLLVCYIMLIQAQPWPVAQANKWYDSQPWLVGCNFIPSTAINQLEMWQGETFDPTTINREMDWAEGIGMNAMRIFLHDLAYKADPAGFKRRMDTVLNMADEHGIKVAFVFFDDCWNAHPQMGVQPKPIPGVHNSGWMQSPGRDVVNNPAEWPRLETYVKDVLSTFKNDSRVLMWDLYNEAGNERQGNRSLPLLKQVFIWARQVNLSQPITACIYSGRKNFNHFLLTHADVITFHNYADTIHLIKEIKSFRKYNRPIICTEWMARTRNSTCETHLPIFKSDKVACFNWGFVSGKTQTIYPWGSKTSNESPKIWFHDLFYADGRPYKAEEINTFKNCTFNLNKPMLPKAVDFDTLIDGERVNLYFLKNSQGLEAAITNYGGKVVSLLVPDKNGKVADVVLGFSNIKDYLSPGAPYFGALIGRYGNRIANGSCTLNGDKLQLTVNNGVNHLHGGTKGFNAVVWKANRVDGQTLELSYLSKDGEQGYPGNLEVKVVYALTDSNELRITYEATTDKPTYVNLTHHSFFNLQGEGNGNIGSHRMLINADAFTPVGEGLIPTGQILPVAGTAFDFRNGKAIENDLYLNDEQLSFGKGYDHNFVLNQPSAPSTKSLHFAARVEEPLSGRVMEVWTNEPGLQFYGGNFLNGNSIGKSGKPYLYRSAFCLETQHFPDSPNHPEFPSTLLNPAEVYRSTCIYKFSAIR